MAVDKKYQHQGIGKELLVSFFTIANILSLKAGGKYLTVDAKSTAMGFYKRFGFKPAVSKKIDDILPMYLDIHRIIDIAENKDS